MNHIACFFPLNKWLNRLIFEIQVNFDSNKNHVKITVKIRETRKTL